MEKDYCPRCDGMGEVIQVTDPSGLIRVAPAYPHTSPFSRLKCAMCKGIGYLPNEQKQNKCELPKEKK